MTNTTRDAEMVARAVLSDCPEALLIAELERRGWGKGHLNVADAAFDMLYRERDVGGLPFDAFEWEQDVGEEALSA